MLSPSHELGSPTAAARRSRKIVLKTLPTLSRVISPTKPTGLTQELSLEYKEENEEEKDSTSVILKPFPPVCKKEMSKKVTISEEQLEKAISLDNETDRELVTDILSLRPRRRGDKEIIILQKALGEIKFFKGAQSQLDEISYERLFQAITLETFLPGEKIFNYGEHGKKFYIIIQGSVYILVKSNGVPSYNTIKDQDKDNSQEDSDEYIKQLRERLSESMQDEDLSDETKKKLIERSNPGFWAVKTMTSGESFGEVALSKDLDGKRTATVVCKEKTSLAILSYDDYHNILGSLYERRYRDNLEFIKGVDIFHHWRPNQLSSIIFNMEEIEFKRKQIIFKEGETGDHIYFIKQGEVELTKNVEKPSNNDKPAGLKKNKNILSPRTQLSKKTEIVKLGIELERDYLGEYELLDFKPMEYTAIAHSTTVVLMAMTREKFVNLVKDETSLKCLNEHIKKKRAWREDLIDKFLLRCKSQKPKEIFPIEDSSVKSALNKKVFQEYFQSIHGTSPTNRPNRFYSSEIYKPAASLEELILPTSPLHAERVINSTKNNFTTASGFFGTSAKPTSINTFETEQTQTKPNLTRYVIPSRSQKKMHGQTYVDHRKWLEETLKGNTENSKLIEGKSIQNSKNTNTITSTSKGMFTIPKNSKLEPLNYVKQTEEQEVKQKAKVWAHYLHAGKNIIKRAEEKNRVVLKVRANQLAGKKGLNLVHQINDLLSKDLIKDSLKKNPTSFKEIKKDNKNREKHYLGHAASEKGLYYNFDGAFEGPSPLVRSLILSYRKIGENKKDLE